MKNINTKNKKSRASKLRGRNRNPKSVRTLYYINDKILFKSFVWGVLPELRNWKPHQFEKLELCPGFVGSRFSVFENGNPASGAFTQGES